MNLYVVKNGRTLGPMDEASVRVSISSGRLAPTDLACHVGGTDWHPLAEVLEQRAPNGSSFVGTVADTITSFAGLEKIQGFSVKATFAAVFRKRSPDEMENYFSIGAPATTPKLESIPVHWPQPWAFIRAFTIAMSAFAASYYMVAHFGNANGIPAFLMLGAFAVPASVLVLFFELNIIRNISLYQVARLALVGGCLSLIVSLFLFGWADKLGLDWLGASQAGIVEETGKLLAMLIVANNPRYRWTLNGLLIGASVGTGFAVVETAGYAFRTMLDDNSVEFLLLLRGSLYLLGGHGLLSAIVGGALWQAKGSAHFDVGILTQGRFLRLFCLSVAAHMLWNSPLQVPYLGKYFAIGFVLWVVILSLVQSGLKQVRSAQRTGKLP